jgi:hypothetical protein
LWQLETADIVAALQPTDGVAHRWVSMKVQASSWHSVAARGLKSSRFTSKLGSDNEAAIEHIDQKAGRLALGQPFKRDGGMQQAIVEGKKRLGANRAL